ICTFMPRLTKCRVFLLTPFVQCLCTKNPGRSSLRLRAIALALRGPPLQLWVRDCRGALWSYEKIAFTTCQMSNVCCAMFNVVVKTPDDLLTKPPNPQWETI